MKTLLFLSRVTFIYNLCMIVALLMGYFDVVSSNEVRSSTVAVGLFLAIVFNGFIHVWIGGALLKYRSVKILQPAWLFIANFLCFLYQIYMLFL